MAGWIAGVDGCAAGWIVALAPADDLAHPVIRVVCSFADIVVQAEAPVLIAVDMPIGLPDSIGGSGRAPEQLVRPLLGQRQSSVFSIPARAAVEAADYRACCAAALATSEPPRKVSKQAFNIFPKIREIDVLLRARPELRNSVFEVHPELAFRTMKGSPLLHPKKVKGAPFAAGMDERRALLAIEGVGESALAQAAPRGAADDDLLDALAGLVAARHIAAGRGRSFPDPPCRDSCGLPIAIWAWRPEAGSANP